MKSITKQFLISCLLFYIGGCSNKQDIKQINKSKDVTINVYEPINQTLDSLSFLAEDINFIKLEYTSVCQLADRPLNICSTNDYVFITEINAIYQFDFSGKFIRRIGYNGRGPGEYPVINSMQLDSSKKLINVFPGKTEGKIIQYDLRGNLVREIKIKNRDYTAFDVSNRYFIFYPFCFEKFQKNYRKLYVIDEQGNDLFSFSSSIYPKIREGSEKVFSYGATRDWSWKHNDRLYFLEANNDTIFEISGDSLLITWLLAGKNRLSLREAHFGKPKDYSNDYIQLTDRTIIPANSCVYETDRFLLFRCFSNQKRYFTIYDKQEEILYRSDYEYQDQEDAKHSDCFLDDLISGLPFNPVYQIANNQLVAIFQPYYLLNQKELVRQFYRKHNTSKTKEFLELCNTLKENDNPVLMIAKMK
ncbi:MAG: 6-bladed beta-propeller [Mangrovibacterium sp.]